MTRQCSKCRVLKAPELFSKGQHYCKPCHVASVRASRDRHPETRKANRAIHMERELVKNREYKRLNKDRINVINRNRKARMKYGRFDNHSHSEVQALLLRQKGKCAVCRIAVGAKYHVDHITALIAGGENEVGNLQILCPPCNLTKGVRDPIEFMQSRGLLI